MEGWWGGVRGIDGRGGADRWIVAMAEGEIGDTAPAGRTGIADYAGLAVGLQGGVRAVEGTNGGRYGARAAICRQQDPRRSRVLQLDKIRLVLDVERSAEPAGERRIG